MRHLSKEFEEGKICVKVESLSKLETLNKIINEQIFLDTSSVYSRLMHGVYNHWINSGIELSIGYINDEKMVDVLSDEYFNDNGYEQISFNEFIENLRKW